MSDSNASTIFNEPNNENEDNTPYPMDGTSSTQVNCYRKKGHLDQKRWRSFGQSFCKLSWLQSLGLLIPLQIFVKYSKADFFLYWFKSQRVSHWEQKILYIWSFHGLIFNSNLFLPFTSSFFWNFYFYPVLTEKLIFFLQSENMHKLLGCNTNYRL